MAETATPDWYNDAVTLALTLGSIPFPKGTKLAGSRKIPGVTSFVISMPGHADLLVCLSPPSTSSI